VKRNEAGNARTRSAEHCRTDGFPIEPTAVTGFPSFAELLLNFFAASPLMTGDSRNAQALTRPRSELPL